jgi:hypothetical protein
MLSQCSDFNNDYVVEYIDKGDPNSSRSKMDEK